MSKRKRFDITDISVCVVCIHLMANGEYDDGEDTAEVCAAGQAKLWGAEARHFVPGDEDQGFSWSRCEGCGDPSGGDRFQAHVMIPIPATTKESD